MTDKRKAPAFQFYPGDWQRDKGLQSCSMAARGLWLELLCAMHDNEPRGKLCTVAGKPMSNRAISTLVGLSRHELARLMHELNENGVFSTDDNGVIYSRRMVKDQAYRVAMIDVGKRGGNPKLLTKGLTLPDKPTDNHSATLRDNQKQTSAFAVAFTSKESIENASSVGEAHDQPDLAEQVRQGQTQTATANGSAPPDKGASFESMVSARGKAAKLPAQPGETFQQWLERIKRAEALRKTGGSA